MLRSPSIICIGIICIYPNIIFGYEQGAKKSFLIELVAPVLEMADLGFRAEGGTLGREEFIARIAVGGAERHDGV